MRVEGHKLIAECTAYYFKSELERKKIVSRTESLAAYTKDKTRNSDIEIIRLYQGLTLWQ